MGPYNKTTGKSYDGENLRCTNDRCGRVFKATKGHLAQGSKICIYCGCKECVPFKQTTASLPKENNDG